MPEECLVSVQPVFAQQGAPRPILKLDQPQVGVAQFLPPQAGLPSTENNPINHKTWVEARDEPPSQ